MENEYHLAEGLDIDPRKENGRLTEKYGGKSRIPPELIDSLREGDPVAFETIYTHMGGPVEDFLAVILHSREDAREITQDVFASVWENRTHFKSDRNFKGYIYVTAKNYALRLLKHRKVELKYTAMVAHSSDDLDHSADSMLRAKETELLIRITLDTMPEKKRRVYEMSRQEGKSEDEIAEALKLTKQTVQVYLSTALKEIRDAVLLFFFVFLSS